MGIIKDSLTFDDVSLIPQHSSIVPNETLTSVELSKNLKLKIPLIASAMDTVTESKMALAIGKIGGIGVIHRNLSTEKQIQEVKKVKKQNLLVGAAIGVSDNDLNRAKKLIKANVDLLVIDTAHGHTNKVFKIIKKIKKVIKRVPLCAGNIATGKAAKFLADSGVDIVKVGIGPGSICTTRLVAGVGVPQLSAVIEVKNALRNRKTKIISDGGIKFSGDLAKAIGAGADAIMIGSLFSGTLESPGKIFKRKGKVKVKGPVNKIIYNLVGGLRASMGDLGAKTIKDLQKKGEFVKITKAGFYESMVHNVDQVVK